MEMPVAASAQSRTRRRSAARHGCGPGAAHGATRDHYQCNYRGSRRGSREPAPAAHRGSMAAGSIYTVTVARRRSTLSPHLNSTRFWGFCAFPGHSRDTDGSVGFLIPQNHTQHRRAPPFMPEENNHAERKSLVCSDKNPCCFQSHSMCPHMRPRVPLPGIPPCIVHTHESLTRRPYGTEGARPSRSAFGCLRPHPASGSRPAG